MINCQYDNFSELFFSNLSQVYSSPHFVNFPRGLKSKEIICANLILKNPIARYCLIPARKSNIVFNFAEVLWYLSGDNSLDFISYYSPNFSSYSEDGEILTGSAYGKKIFDFLGTSINQWEKVYNLLASDPDSKRAVIQIFDPSENLGADNIDVSCSMFFHFMIRNNKLHLFYHMRANDAFRGIVSDVFSATFMQELMARQLNIEVGSYYHFVDSMDLFESDFEACQLILNEGMSVDPNDFIFPSLPMGDNWSSLKTVMYYEKKIRKDGQILNFDVIEQLFLPKYWKHVIGLFSLYQSVLRGSVDFQLFHSLPKVYQFMLRNKWPKHFFR